jgi:hypothetical protein
MNSDVMTQASMASLGGIALNLSNRNLLKSPVSATHFPLFAAISMTHALAVQAQGSSNTNNSSEQMMFQLKECQKLLEEQSKKMQRSDMPCDRRHQTCKLEK